MGIFAEFPGEEASNDSRVVENGNSVLSLLISSQALEVNIITYHKPG